MMLTAAVMLCGTLGGCATHAEKRQAVVERWEKTTAQGKLPMVESLIERGRIADAEKTLRESLDADPTSPHAHFLMGRVLLIEDRRDEARVSFAEAVSLDASYDAAWYHLGVLFDLDGNHKRAADAYHTALSLKPVETDYILAMAQSYIRAGHPEQARELLEDRLNRQPGNRDLLLGMADLSSRTGQPDQTIVYYEQILMADGKDLEVLESLGYCYAAKQDWNSAAQSFAKLLNLVKDDVHKQSILETLALCTFNAGRYGEAMKYYDRLSVQRRDDAEVWLNMAQAALGAAKYQRAEDNANRALQLKPSWPQGYAVLGSAQYLMGKYDEAIQSFSYACRDDAVGGYAWFMTGRCYARLGQTASAEAAYEKAGNLGADSPLMIRFLRDNADSL